MATPTREAIDTFMSITGSSEAVSLQRLQEHDGDLNQAVNAHFSEGDGNSMQTAPAPTSAADDLMEIDRPLFSGTRGLTPFSLLDPDFTNRLFDRSPLFDSISEVGRRAPIVSHPREVREIPIEVRDGIDTSARSGRGPTIVDVTDTELAQGPEIRGNVTINDDDDDDDDADSLSDIGSRPRPSAPAFDAIPHDGIDVEEEMIRAAIEASKRDAALPTSHDPGNAGRREEEPNHDDDEISLAVSLSLKTAEQERALREQGVVVGESNPSAPGLIGADWERISNPNSRKGVGSSSTADMFEELEEQPLVRHRSRRVPSNTSVNPHPEFDQTVDEHPLGDLGHAEWGGISSAEHDEAVMLEAAMFGSGLPEEGRFNFPQQAGFGRTWRAPRPPSPGLQAQREIREQQDDAYLAALNADRERELKALEEERVSKRAALEEERRKEEEARRKIEEEQELERYLAAREASLPQEPAADDGNAVTVLVRMPDGSRRGRRFLRSDKLKSLYDFIDVGRSVKPGTYRVVRPYPRRPFSEAESSSSLSDLGLTSKQEALYLEPI